MIPRIEAAHFFALFDSRLLGRVWTSKSAWTSCFHFVTSCSLLNLLWALVLWNWFCKIHWFFGIIQSKGCFLDPIISRCSVYIPLGFPFLALLLLVLRIQASFSLFFCVSVLPWWFLKYCVFKFPLDTGESQFYVFKPDLIISDAWCFHLDVSWASQIDYIPPRLLILGHTTSYPNLFLPVSPS